MKIIKKLCNSTSIWYVISHNVSVASILKLSSFCDKCFVIFYHDWLDLPSKSLLYIAYNDSLIPPNGENLVKLSSPTAPRVQGFWISSDTLMTALFAAGFVYQQQILWRNQFLRANSLFWSLSSLTWTRNIPPSINFAAFVCVRKRQLLNPAFQCILPSRHTACRYFLH